MGKLFRVSGLLLGLLGICEGQMPSVLGLATQGSCAAGLNPCLHENLCTLTVMTIGKVKCGCPPGYAGDGLRHGGTGCVDVDECVNNTHTCGNGSRCINTEGSFSCACKEGYEWNERGTACRDVDECVKNPRICGGDASISRCVNTEGGFECQCEDKFKAMNSALQCVDKDECTYKNGIENDCEQRCINKERGYDCACNEGYAIDPMNPKRCIDVDECANGTHTCAGRCTNTVGGYACECLAENGEKLDPSTGRCVDINECYENPNVCPEGCCKNLPAAEGKYKCSSPASVTASGIDLNSYSAFLPEDMRDLASAMGLLGAPLGLSLGGGSQVPVQSVNCFVSDVGIDGFNVLSEPLESIVSADSCQSFCAGNSACQYFAYNKETRKCYLKTSQEGRKVEAGLVSGPRVCQSSVAANQGPVNIFGSLIGGAPAALGGVISSGARAPAGIANAILTGSGISSLGNQLGITGAAAAQNGLGQTVTEAPLFFSPSFGTGAYFPGILQSLFGGLNPNILNSVPGGVFSSLIATFLGGGVPAQLHVTSPIVTPTVSAASVHSTGSSTIGANAAEDLSVDQLKRAASELQEAQTQANQLQAKLQAQLHATQMQIAQLEAQQRLAAKARERGAARAPSTTQAVSQPGALPASTSTGSISANSVAGSRTFRSSSVGKGGAQEKIGERDGHKGERHGAFKASSIEAGTKKQAASVGSSGQVMFSAAEEGATKPTADANVSHTTDGISHSDRTVHSSFHPVKFSDEVTAEIERVPRPDKKDASHLYFEYLDDDMDVARKYRDQTTGAINLLEDQAHQLRVLEHRVRTVAEFVQLHQNNEAESTGEESLIARRRLQAGLWGAPASALTTIFGSGSPVALLTATASPLLPPGLSGVLPSSGRSNAVCPPGYKSNQQWVQRKQLDALDRLKRNFQRTMTDQSRDQLMRGLLQGSMPETVLGDLSNSTVTNMLPEPFATLLRGAGTAFGGGTGWQALIPGFEAGEPAGNVAGFARRLQESHPRRLEEFPDFGSDTKNVFDIAGTEGNITDTENFTNGTFTLPPITSEDIIRHLNLTGTNATEFEQLFNVTTDANGTTIVTDLEGKNITIDASAMFGPLGSYYGGPYSVGSPYGYRQYGSNQFGPNQYRSQYSNQYAPGQFNGQIGNNFAAGSYVGGNNFPGGVLNNPGGIINNPIGGNHYGPGGQFTNMPVTNFNPTGQQIGNILNNRPIDNSVIIDKDYYINQPAGGAYSPFPIFDRHYNPGHFDPRYYLKPGDQGWELPRYNWYRPGDSIWFNPSERSYYYPDEKLWVMPGYDSNWEYPSYENGWYRPGDPNWYHPGDRWYKPGDNIWYHPTQRVWFNPAERLWIKPGDGWVRPNYRWENNNYVLDPYDSVSIRPGSQNQIYNNFGTSFGGNMGGNMVGNMAGGMMGNVGGGILNGPRVF